MPKTRRDLLKVPSAAELLKQLKAAPLVDLRGVLSESGVGGVRLGPEKSWTLSFQLAAWRVGNGPLQQSTMYVRRPGVRLQDIDKYQRGIPKNCVVRFRARVIEKSIWDRPDALLVRLMGTDESDVVLNAEIQRLQEPVTFTDSVLGEFELNRAMNCYETETRWNRREVVLTLEAEKATDIKRALKVAHRLWESQKVWNEKALACADEKLLPLKNANWLGEGERPLTVRKFRRQLSLSSIHVSPNGSFDFWFDGGDLFFDHAVQVIGSLKRGAYDATLQG